MRKRLTFVAIACAVLAVAAATATAATAPAPAGTVTFLAGQASRITGGKATPLAVGGSVFAGDVVETQKRTRLEIKLADASVLRLGPSAKVDLSAASFGRTVEERQVSAKLQVGTVWAKVAKTVGGESRFEVKTENAVAGVRGTTFRVDAAQDRSVVVKVYNGTVAVAGGNIPRPEHGGDDAGAEPTRTDEPTKVAAAGTGTTQPATTGTTAGTGTAQQTTTGTTTGTAGGKKVRKQVAAPKQVTKEQWEKIVTAMMVVKVSADGTATEPESFALATPAEDDWEVWNRERDAIE